MDPVRRLVALNTTPPPPTPSSSAPTKDTPSDYHIFHISRLLKVDVLSPAPSTPENTPKQVNPAAGEDRLRKAVLAEKKKEERVGKGVTKEAQVVFDGILRTGLPTRWVGKDIMVMDSVLVTSPYGSQNCKSVDKNNQALARVKKVVSPRSYLISVKYTSSANTSQQLENEKQKRSSALRKGENASSPKGDARKGG